MEGAKIGLVNQPWGYIEPPITRGGSIPILLYELARRLVGQYEVTYFTRGSYRYERRHESGVEFIYVPVVVDKLLYRLQSKFHLFPESASQPFFSSRWSYPRFAHNVGVAARQHGCDIVHLNNYPQFAPIIRRQHPKAKIIMHMHCEWLSQLDHDATEVWLRDIDMVLCCSNFVRNRVQAAHPRFAARCHTLYNGVFIKRFKPADRAARGGVNRIIYVGRIAPEKGVHILVQAVGLLADRYPQLQLDLVGPDEIMPLNHQVGLSKDPEILKLAPLYAPQAYAMYLWKLVEEMGLSNRVTFHGAVGHAQGLVELYQQTDIAVVPSIWNEPFGMPVIEAMATGAPVIVTRSGAFPELVRDGENGLSVNRASPPELAAAIERLIVDDSLRKRLGIAGREHVLNHFSWDSIVQQLSSCYERLLSQSASTT